MTLQVKTGRFQKTTTTTAGIIQSITGVGFQPKAIIFWTVDYNSTIAGDGARFSLGFSDGVNDRSQSIISDDNLVSPVVTQTENRYDDSALHMIDSTGVLTWDMELQSFDSDGFTVKFNVNTAYDAYVNYIAISGTSGSNDCTNVLVSDFACPTVTGNQSITGVGFKPDLIIFLPSEVLGANTSSDDAPFALGAAVSSTQRFAVATNSEDAITPSNSYRTQRTDRCIMKYSGFNPVLDAEADFVSMDSDGFTINWSNAASAADKVAYIAIKGLNIKIGSFNTNTATGNQSITGVGFQPLITLFSTYGAATSTANQDGARLSFGAGTGSTSRFSTWYGMKDNATTTTESRQESSSTVYGIGDESTTGRTSKCIADFVSNDSDGFTINHTTADTIAHEICYISLTSLSLVNNTSTHKYNVAGYVSNTSTHIYNMGGMVSATLTCQYNVASGITQLVNNDCAFVYNIAETTFTSNANYIKPLRPVIKIMDRLGKTTLMDYDSFNPSTTLRVLSCTFQVGQGTAGTFEIIIEDSNRILDRTKIKLGNRVLISVGKNADRVYKAFLGYVRRFRTSRPDTGVLHYHISGYGTQIRTNERYTIFEKVAQRTNLETGNPDKFDPRMQAYRLFANLFQDSDHLPVGEPLEDFTVNHVFNPADSTQDNENDDPPERVTEFIPSIQESLVEWSTVLDKISQATGSVWGVDADNDVYLRYPTLSHSGITLKDTIEPTDDKETTAYFVDAWDFEDTMEKAEGFANRLYGKAQIPNKLDLLQEDASGFISLYNKDIAIPFTSTSAQFRDLAIVMSNIGEKDLAEKFVRGRIYIDGGDNTPTGEQVAAFTINKSDIGPEPTVIYKMNLSITTPVVQIDKKHWLVFYARGVDEENTVRVHHDNSTTNQYGIRTPSTGSLTNNAPFTILTNGPKFALATFTSTNQLTEASDPDSIDEFGLVEAIIDADFITEAEMMDRYLSAILNWSAKPKRIYDVKSIIPPDKPIQPGKLITIIDSKSSLSAETGVDAEVLDITYRFEASENGLGARYIEIRPIGYFDFTTVLPPVTEPIDTEEGTSDGSVK